jgi:hypothetical protein
MQLTPLVLNVANLSVSGVVVDEDGEPVTNVEVNCSGRGQPDRWDIPADEQGRFKIDGVCAGPLRLWANGRGERRMYGDTESEGGATDVKIVVHERDSRGRRISKQPPSLLGKPLPGFDDITGDLSPEQTKNKTLLICFFDIQQRPSRHCMTQLAKQAARLKEKGIAILAVQASKVEQTALDEWAKNQGITFPVAAIVANEKKTRFKWGVKSLPWLILADERRVVVAEGFGVGDIDNKLAGVEGKS